MSDDDSDDKYIVSLRGALTRAPANAADPESVFRAESALNASEVRGGVVVPQPGTDLPGSTSRRPGSPFGAYSPFAEKWKEFDKLQKSANSGGKAQLVHWAWA